MVTTPEPQVSIRELRAHLATHVRRAGAGDPVTISVDGRPVARLVPLGRDGSTTLDDLVAGGLVDPPRRKERATPPQPNPAIAGLDTSRILAELRGR